jgi:hypothetical protein
MKPRTESDPFISLNLRAFIEAKDPYEQAAVTALVFWHWWKGNNEGLGVDGLAALGKMSPAKAKAVAADLKARGWIETSRTFGGKTQYRLTVEKMNFKEAYKIAANWLPQSQLDSDQLALWEPPSSHTVAANELPQSQPNSKNIDLIQTKRTDSPAVAGNGKHPDQDSFWESAKASFSLKNSGAELGWPRDAKGFNKNLTAELTRLGGVELARRWDNMVNDPWATASLRNFIMDTDKWIKRREKLTGGTNARPFNQPKTDWQPTSRG